MTKLCAVCVLPAKTRDAIDRALVKGETYKSISHRFKRRVSIFALCRHRKHLLPKDLVRQAPPPKPEAATTLLERVESLITESRSIAEQAKHGKQWMAASGALREVRSCLELLGKLSGQLSSGVNINFLNGVFSEEQLEAFLDGVKKRPEALALLNRMLGEKLGLHAPVTHIHFVKSDGNGHRQLIEEVSSAGDVITSTDVNAYLIKELRDVCVQDPEFRKLALQALIPQPAMLDGSLSSEAV